MNTTDKRAATLNGAREAYLRASAERRRLAYTMKKDGKCTFREIGEKLGVSRQRAQAMCVQARKELKKSAGRNPSA